MRGSKRVFFLKTFCSGIHLYTFLDRQSQFWLRMDVDTVGKVFVTEISTRQMKKKKKRKRSKHRNKTSVWKLNFYS